MRSWVLWVTDPHAGHIAAPLPPDIELAPTDDGTTEPYRPAQTALQRQLHQWWTEDLEAVQRQVNKEPMIVVVGGDVTHGDRAKYPDKELVSDRVSDQVHIAFELFRPLLDWPNVRAIRIAKGTGNHVFQRGDSEVMLATRLKDRGADAEAWYHMELEWAGVTLDVAHHGAGPGIRQWTRGNQVRYYVRSLQDECSRNGHAIPDAVLRGHFHQPTIEHVPFPLQTGTRWTWGVVGPPYCSMDDYGRKVTKSKRLISVGMLLLEIVDNRVVWVHEFLHGIDLARREMF